jgi:hypothetical protein
MPIATNFSLGPDVSFRGETEVGRAAESAASVENDGGLNGSTQHFILSGKDGVYGDVSRISSRFHCGRESGLVGSLAKRGVAESDRASVW